MHKLLILAASAALLAAPTTSAQSDQGSGQGGGRLAAMFAMADANHDGTITRAEFDAARAARFAQRDADHNGVLTASEMPHWGNTQPAGGEAPHLRGDTNGDGSVSRAEWDAESAVMFSRLDANNDGVISQAELQAAEQRMQAMQH